MARILTRDELNKWINGLSADYDIYAPKELTAKGIFYQRVADGREVYLGDDFSVEPAKKFFFKPSEYLFSGKFKEGREILEDAALNEKKKMVLGLRPCEAKALALLDKVFDSETKDSFYAANRNNFIVIGLSCLNPDKDCFCTSLGGSPVENRGMDAEVFIAGDSFIIEGVSAKGSSLLSGAGRVLSGQEEKAWDTDKRKRRDALKREIKIPQALDKIFESDYWEQASAACLSCGICTFICPTCHCFDLIDEERKKLRCYDGCAFSDFTLEASGTNPRPGKKERYRQRVYHKFDYFKKNFGEDLCVGCGRCIRHCPVKMDISEVVAKAR